MRTDYQILCLLKAASPITHMRGVEGNEAVIMREPVAAENCTRWVPMLSGNAIRHAMVREPGFVDLLKRYDLMGRLSLAQFNLLLHGGALTEGTRSSDLKRSAAGQRAIPLFRVLGGALPNEIAAGWLDVGRGMLVCLENQRRIKALAPEASGDLADFSGAPGQHLHPAEHFVSPYQYTRGDAGKWLPDNDPGNTNLMIFSGQQVNPGAAFVAQLRLREASEVDAGAVLTALELWSGVIGGQRSRGHGQLQLSYRVTTRAGEVAAQPLIDAYQSHVDGHRDAAVSWLYEVFGEPAPKEVLGAIS